MMRVHPPRPRRERGVPAPIPPLRERVVIRYAEPAEREPQPGCPEREPQPGCPALRLSPKSLTREPRTQESRNPEPKRAATRLSRPDAVSRPPGGAPKELQRRREPGEQRVFEP